MAAISVDDFVTKTMTLLDEERAAESEESLKTLATMSSSQAEARGVSVIGVDIASTHVGLYGRIQVSFALPNGRPLPSMSRNV